MNRMFKLSTAAMGAVLATWVGVAVDPKCKTTDCKDSAGAVLDGIEQGGSLINTTNGSPGVATYVGTSNTANAPGTAVRQVPVQGRFVGASSMQFTPKTLRNGEVV